jgi:hypothetical protein
MTARNLLYNTTYDDTFMEALRDECLELGHGSDLETACIEYFEQVIHDLGPEPDKDDLQDYIDGNYYLGSGFSEYAAESLWDFLERNGFDPEEFSA